MTSTAKIIKDIKRHDRQAAVTFRRCQAPQIGFDVLCDLQGCSLSVHLHILLLIEKKPDDLVERERDLREGLEVCATDGAEAKPSRER